MLNKATNKKKKKKKKIPYIYDFNKNTKKNLLNKVTHKEKPRII